MKIPLLEVQNKIDYEDYTLKEIALYFEKYHGYVCKIQTENKTIKFGIEKYALPHILGLQHAYANQKNSRMYKGKKGFELLKSGKISMEQLKQAIKKNPHSEIAWKNIRRRIEFLPMFFNTIEKKTRVRIIEMEKIFRTTALKGSYALFKMVDENGKKIYPMLSLKETPQKQVVIETFIVEDDITLLGGLEEEKILKIELISPLDNTMPQTIILDLDEKAIKS